METVFETALQSLRFGWREVVEKKEVLNGVLVKKWSREIIIEKLKDLDANDVFLSGPYIRRVDPKFYRAACRYFGSWENALKAAGNDYVKDLFTRLSPQAKRTLKKAISKKSPQPNK